MARPHLVKHHPCLRDIVFSDCQEIGVLVDVEIISCKGEAYIVALQLRGVARRRQLQPGKLYAFRDGASGIYRLRDIE